MQCATCLKASSIVRNGESKRFCQRCGGFHPLQDFEGDKRSCRISLMKHNYHRRKKGTTGNGVSKEADVAAKVSRIGNCVFTWGPKATVRVCTGEGQDISALPRVNLDNMILSLVLYRVRSSQVEQFQQLQPGLYCPPPMDQGETRGGWFSWVCLACRLTVGDPSCA
jgi:hypothetical protein